MSYIPSFSTAPGADGCMLMHLPSSLSSAATQAVSKPPLSYDQQVRQERNEKIDKFLRKKIAPHATAPILSPEIVELCKQGINKALSSGDYEGAKELLFKACTETPNFPDILLILKMCLKIAKKEKSSQKVSHLLHIVAEIIITWKVENIDRNAVHKVAEFCYNRAISMKTSSEVDVLATISQGLISRLASALKPEELNLPLQLWTYFHKNADPRADDCGKLVSKLLNQKNWKENNQSCVLEIAYTYLALACKEVQRDKKKVFADSCFELVQKIRQSTTIDQSKLNQVVLTLGVVYMKMPGVEALELATLCFQKIIKLNGEVMIPELYNFFVTQGIEPLLKLLKQPNTSTNFGYMPEEYNLAARYLDIAGKMIGKISSPKQLDNETTKIINSWLSVVLTNPKSDKNFIDKGLDLMGLRLDAQKQLMLENHKNVKEYELHAMMAQYLSALKKSASYCIEIAQKLEKCPDEQIKWGKLAFKLALDTGEIQSLAPRILQLCIHDNEEALLMAGQCAQHCSKEDISRKIDECLAASNSAKEPQTKFKILQFAATLHLQTNAQNQNLTQSLIEACCQIESTALVEQCASLIQKCASRLDPAALLKPVDDCFLIWEKPGSWKNIKWLHFALAIDQFSGKEKVKETAQKIITTTLSMRDADDIPLLLKCISFCDPSLVLQTAESCFDQGVHATRGLDVDDGAPYYQASHSRLKWIECAFNLAQKVGQSQAFAPRAIEQCVKNHQLIEALSLSQQCAPFCQPEFLITQADHCMKKGEWTSWRKEYYQKKGLYDIAFNLVQKTEIAHKFVSRIIDDCLKHTPFYEDAVELALKYAPYCNSETKLKIFNNIIERANLKVFTISEGLAKLILFNEIVNQRYLTLPEKRRMELKGALDYVRSKVADETTETIPVVLPHSLWKKDELTGEWSWTNKPSPALDARSLEIVTGYL